MIVLGDHQPAASVGLDERSDVPLHLIGPAHLIDRARVDWGLRPGLLPADDMPVTPMERMRDCILTSFTGTSPVGER